uniref:Ran-binding protein 3-like n=1 Tax=Oncorhynchus tshawytscha TaxID=74940 RepID=A0A8C8HV61_ONCTS
MVHEEGNYVDILKQHLKTSVKLKLDSDKDESSYCPPAKRERTSSLTQFPPAHSVSKNNVFMPSSFCQSPTGNNNSDSEPEEKTVGFRLKPPTLIHGQAPSAGVPSQKPKEQQRSVLRPAVLQAPLCLNAVLVLLFTDNNVTESLEESAAAYTKATAKRCLLEKVEVRTGEESESNVLQVQCKLFVFDKASQSWVERGRGLLRLNDMASTEEGSLQSRLVMRTQGSLRLILNTKLWPQMQTDKASEKSVRITAMDTEDQGVKVFLISASSKDTGQLYAALHHRILALRSRSDQEPEPRVPIPDGHIPHPQSNGEDSDEDEPLTPTANTTGKLYNPLA